MSTIDHDGIRSFLKAVVYQFVLARRPHLARIYGLIEASKLQSCSGNVDSGAVEFSLARWQDEKNIGVTCQPSNDEIESRCRYEEFIELM